MTSDLRAELEALAFGWRNMADSDRSSPLASAALRGCADELEFAIARHAPTDAPPPTQPDP